MTWRGQRDKLGVKQPRMIFRSAYVDAFGAAPPAPPADKRRLAGAEAAAAQQVSPRVRKARPSSSIAQPPRALPPSLTVPD